MNIDGFISYLKQRPDRSSETVKSYQSDLELFAGFLAERKLRITQVTQTLILEYIKLLESQPNSRTGAIGLSRATIQRRLISIRQFFSYMRATTNPKLRDPTFGIKVGDLNNDDCKAVDEDVITNLLAGITIMRDRVMISLFLSSGLRLSELHQLNRDSISAEHHVNESGDTHVVGTGEVIGKRSKRRRFYIDEDTINDLVDYLATRDDEEAPLFLSSRGTRISKRSIQDVVKRWCAKLGITDLHVHQFRHQACTRMANAGIDAQILKTVMGHKDLRTTNRYFKLYDSTVARQYHAAMEMVKLRRG